MSFNLKLTGDTSNYVQEVDINHNAKVNLPLTDIQSGFASLLAENDAGTITGSRYVKAVEVSDDFRVRVGLDNMIFNEQFPGSAVNTGIWSQILTTFTASVSSGFLSINAAAVNTSAAVGQVRTYRHFPCYKQFSTYCEMEVQFTQLPQSGSRCEWGLFLAATTAAPTDGAFFRYNETGEFRCVMNYNGTEIQSGTLDASLLVGVNSTKSFLIYVGSGSVTFWIDNIMISELFTPVGQGSSVSSMNLPMAFRNYNVSTTSSAQVMKIGNVNVTIGDQASYKPWGHILSGSSASATQGQTGSTLGSTAIYVNAAAAAAAALTNTTAAAQFTGLGGICNILPTLTAGTDGIAFSYQVPLGTSTLPGKSLYVTGVSVDGAVTTILAGGPVIYAYSIAYGHTAVSLATTETATSKAPRRVPLGIQTYAATAAVGTLGIRLQDDYTCSPIFVQPGEFIQLVVRNLGTVTTTGAITISCALTGYWE